MDAESVKIGDVIKKNPLSGFYFAYVQMFDVYARIIYGFDVALHFLRNFDCNTQFLVETAVEKIREIFDGEKIPASFLLNESA